MKDFAQSTIVKLRAAAACKEAADRPGVPRQTAINQLEPPWVPPDAASSGERLYDTRPLRFRGLVGPEADPAMLEMPGRLHDGFKIRVAKLRGRRQQARKLVERRYAGRGYTIPPMPQDPELSTFLAYDEGQLVGTVSVRLDSERGLSAETLYAAEINLLRSIGCHVCEFTRLAVDKTAASKAVLAGLFHTAYLYASCIRGCTHALIEVNPRHVAYYRRALRFDPIGEERLNSRVNAPAVLLCAPFAGIADGIRKFAGRPEAPGAVKSLFLFGFSPEDESGVLRRLWELVAAS